MVNTLYQMAPWQQREKEQVIRKKKQDEMLKKKLIKENLTFNKKTISDEDIVFNPEKQFFSKKIDSKNII